MRCSLARCFRSPLFGHTMMDRSRGDQLRHRRCETATIAVNHESNQFLFSIPAPARYEPKRALFIWVLSKLGLWKPLVLTQSRELSPHPRIDLCLSFDRRRSVVVDESPGGDNFLFIRRPLLTDDGEGDVAAFPCFRGEDVAKKLSEELIGTPKFDKVSKDLR